MSAVFFHKTTFLELFPLLVKAFPITLSIVLFSFVFSLCLSFILLALQCFKPTQYLVRVAVQLINGLPALAILFFFYFSIVYVVRLDSLSSLIIGLSVIYSINLEELWLSAFRSIPKQQHELVLTLGLKSINSFFYIYLPQMFNFILPSLVNQWINLVKDSALGSALAIGEMTYITKTYAASSFHFMDSFLILLLCYMSITLSLSCLSWYLWTKQNQKQ